MTAIALAMNGITKNFGGVQALRGADFVATAGEIHALCGENGAGKSTLLKVLAGVYPAGSYEGEVRVFDRVARFRSTTEARASGVAIVHQELMLVPELSVAENLMLGREPRRWGLIDDAALEAHAKTLLARFGSDDIDPRARVGSLGIGMQQVVEIVRALSYDAQLLVLDEPTAALTHAEAERLMDWLRALRARGTTCIYVSHRMDEIFQIADRVTVLRDGRTAGTTAIADTSSRQVVAWMVGRELATEDGRDKPPSIRHGDRPPALVVQGLSVAGLTGFAVEDVSFDVAAGEIVAVCGAMGSGRTALLSTLFGAAHSRVTGEVTIAGKSGIPASPREAIRAGAVLVPEDRKGRGLVLAMSVAENLALPWLDDPHVFGAGARVGLIDEFVEQELAARRIRELGIRGAASSIVSTLSGGNQQKVVLGKWLEQPPHVLLLDEPTRGVDVGAREEIYALLHRLAAGGAGVLFASSDLEEVVRFAERVIVLRRGRIVAHLHGRDITQARLALLTTGAGSDAEGVHSATVSERRSGRNAEDMCVS